MGLIQANMQRTYGLTFPIYGKIEVNGANAAPLFTYLKQVSSADSVSIPEWYGLKESGLKQNDIQWNFSKFLVVIESDLSVRVRRYDYNVEPVNLAVEIAAALTHIEL